ncbi:MAG: enoyl-CoA hydratase/isomerase family protein [Planctomycetota bacterium]|nr:enoyl-CoA hydratase/isomerase family protein [Planctomycetota bacterium]
MYQNIRFEEREGIARVTLARPPLNILNIEMMGEICVALEGLLERDDIKAVAFFGEGKSFSAGVDVGEHIGEKASMMLEVFHRIFRLLIEIEKPSVAVVGGAALGGGCELATFCDVVIASENAKFGQPEVAVGVFPPVAAALWQFLPSSKRALELLLTGEVVSAEEALKAGIVSRVVGQERLMEEAEKVLGSFSRMSGKVLRYAKRAAWVLLREDFENALGEIEQIYLGELMRSKDAEEGLKAFLEKRKPMWRNE